MWLEQASSANAYMAFLLQRGAGEADVPATIRARARHSDKYAAHLVVEPPNSSPYKEAATVIGRHHVATFAHGGHEEWTLGQQLQVGVATE